MKKLRTRHNRDAWSANNEQARAKKLGMSVAERRNILDVCRALVARRPNMSIHGFMDLSDEEVQAILAEPVS